MIRLIFVCHGNICRSPMAEFVFKNLARESGILSELSICSRATSCEEIWNGQGNPIYPPAQKVLRQHNIPYEEKFAQRITSDECEMSDMLIVMDRNNLKNLNHFLKSDSNLKSKVWMMLDFVRKPEDVEVNRLSAGDIADPWYTGEFSKCYDQILSGCEGLINYIFFLLNLKKIH